MTAVRSFFSEIRALFYNFQKRAGETPLPLFYSFASICHKTFLWFFSKQFFSRLNYVCNYECNFKWSVNICTFGEFYVMRYENAYIFSIYYIYFYIFACHFSFEKIAFLWYDLPRTDTQFKSKSSSYQKVIQFSCKYLALFKGSFVFYR